MKYAPIFLLIFPLVCNSENFYKIDANSAFQVFDGIGAVSGGGATSKLLFTYFPKIEQRRKILEVMFNNSTGLQILKVEIGGDDQSTEGSEKSHESEFGKLSIWNYEFQLISEVLNVNPNVRICALPWAFPGWIGKDSPFEDEKRTSRYIINWLKIARQVYNFEVYCIGVWNERNFSESYVRILRNELNLANFQKTKIVAGEGFRMNESYDRLLDPGFINDYDIIGVHYPGGQIPEKVRNSGKIIWASEDFSTDNRGTGTGCMARTINWNYVHGNITGILTWHLMSAFYPKIAWYRCGLAYLDEEWFRTEKAFDVLRYTTAHVKPGWKFLSHGQGSGTFSKGGTYVSYTNGTHLVIVVETMSHKSSLCEYSSPPPFKVSKAQEILFEFSRPFANLTGIWSSFNFRPPKFLKLSKNLLKFDVKVDSVGVLANFPLTIPTGVEIPVKSLPRKYYDDFEGYNLEGAEPFFWTSQKGTLEVSKGHLVQKVKKAPISWCTSEIRTPYAVMKFRDNRDFLGGAVKIPAESEAGAVILGLRSNCSGCDIGATGCGGVYAEIEIRRGKVEIFEDFVKRNEIAQVLMKKSLKFDNFYKFEFQINGTYLDLTFGRLKLSLVLPDWIFSKTNANSFFLIGTGNFGTSIWDNLKVG